MGTRLLPPSCEGDVETLQEGKAAPSRTCSERSVLADVVEWVRCWWERGLHVTAGNLSNQIFKFTSILIFFLLFLSWAFHLKGKWGCSPEWMVTPEAGRWSAPRACLQGWSRHGDSRPRGQMCSEYSLQSLAHAGAWSVVLEGMNKWMNERTNRRVGACCGCYEL